MRLAKAPAFLPNSRVKIVCGLRTQKPAVWVEPKVTLFALRSDIASKLAYPHYVFIIS